MYLHWEQAMQVARWGNSLAVRIPAKTVKALALKEGDTVELELTVVQSDETLRAEKRAAALERLQNLPKFLSADFKFDREEANRRR
jgi:antitoxin MazE